MNTNLSIKGVPQVVAERLRLRAQQNHRSLQGELMAIIERAAAEVHVAEALPQRQGLRDANVSRRGSKTIEQIAAEHRARFPRPIASGPLAVDIIRADRDSR